MLLGWKSSGYLPPVTCPRTQTAPINRCANALLDESICGAEGRRPPSCDIRSSWLIRDHDTVFTGAGPHTGLQDMILDRVRYLLNNLGMTARAQASCPGPGKRA